MYIRQKNSVEQCASLKRYLTVCKWRFAQWQTTDWLFAEPDGRSRSEILNTILCIWDWICRTHPAQGPQLDTINLPGTVQYQIIFNAVEPRQTNVPITLHDWPWLRQQWSLIVTGKKRAKIRASENAAAACPREMWSRTPRNGPRR